jgi:hypothetical protein
MLQNKTIQATLVNTTRITATPDKAITWLMLYVCLAYHYKVIACGLFGRVLGFDWICNTLIYGVTTNHWFEHLVYVPILWYVFYRLVLIVFGPHEGEVLGIAVRRAKFFALFLATMYVYATGIHFVNTLEILSRKYLNISSGDLYDQIYWLDELMSHWLQFFFYFLFFAWLIVYDRLDRVEGGKIAIFTGLLHGMERAIGVIEGDNPHSAVLFGTWILIACFIRWKNHGKDFKRVWKDFFFRHGLSFGISMPIALLLYQFVFHGFVQPSAMEDHGWVVIVFAGVFILFGFLVAILMDFLLAKYNKSIGGVT